MCFTLSLWNTWSVFQVFTHGLFSTSFGNFLWELLLQSDLIPENLIEGGGRVIWMASRKTKSSNMRSVWMYGVKRLSVSAVGSVQRGLNIQSVFSYAEHFILDDLRGRGAAVPAVITKQQPPIQNNESQPNSYHRPLPLNSTSKRSAEHRQWNSKWNGLSGSDSSLSFCLCSIAARWSC